MNLSDELEGLMRRYAEAVEAFHQASRELLGEDLHAIDGQHQRRRSETNERFEAAADRLTELHLEMSELREAVQLERRRHAAALETLKQTGDALQRTAAQRHGDDDVRE